MGPVYMIGEKASDMIKLMWRKSTWREGGGGVVAAANTQTLLNPLKDMTKKLGKTVEK
jgi:hypothetical protein